MGMAFFIWGFAIVMAAPLCLGIAIGYIRQFYQEEKERRLVQEKKEDILRAAAESEIIRDSWGNSYHKRPEWFYEKYPEWRNRWNSL